MHRALFFLLAMFALPSSAAIYKWVDETGKVQYSDKPPANQAKQGVTELSRQGMKIKQSEGVLTADQQAAKDAELAKQKEEQRAVEEARRRDRALVDSFSNTAEIDRIRDQAIAQLTAGVQADEVRRDAVSKRVDEDNVKIDKINKAKKPIPEFVASQLSDHKAELAKIVADLQQKQQEIENVKAKAEADKKRLVQLRGQSVVAAPKTSSTP
jgi:hypothetical protein